ncbi:MAG: DUF4114 domain-containing protein [Prochloraceae cyanobacterium]|nr:DUF4114 domain-containing protein [Prochloraceae cyanobacterium]
MSRPSITEIISLPNPNDPNTNLNLLDDLLSPVAQEARNAPEPQFLSISKSQNNDDIYTIGGTPQESTSLRFTVIEGDASFVNEIGVIFADRPNGGIESIEDRTVVVNPEDPNYLQEALDLGRSTGGSISSTLGNNFLTQTTNTIFPVLGGSDLVFYLVPNSTTSAAQTELLARNTPTVFFAPVAANQDGFDHLQGSEPDPQTGQFTLRWEDLEGGGDRDFNDLVMRVEPVNEFFPVGTDLQGFEEGEFISLVLGAGPNFPTLTRQQLVRAEFEVLGREAEFDNFVGFYKVDPRTGLIADRLGNLTGIGFDQLGSISYARTAFQQRVENFDSDSTVPVDLEGGFIYVPFLVADGTPNEDFTNIYFPFLDANPQGVDHVRLLGDNTFAFEDTAGGGDLDYNDLVFRVNLTNV